MNNNSTDTTRTVSAVGNSWVVCKSKSHPGHVYYFNTQTGEAVWNLSEAEIEKVNIQSHDGQMNAKFLSHPEPKNNPPTIKRLAENESYHQTSQALVQQNPGMNIIQLQKQSTDITMNNMPNFDLSNFNNAINLISTPTVLNTTGWHVSPSHQLFISPKTFLNEGQPTVNISYSHNQAINTDHSAAAFKYNNFRNRHNRKGRTQNRQGRPYLRNNFVRGGGRKTNKCQMPQNDLRQRLHLNRLLGNIANQSEDRLSSDDNNKQSSSSQLHKTDIETEDVGSFIDDQIEEDISTSVKSNLQDRSKEVEIKETPSKLDLSPLKSLAPANAKPEIWYIVVDLKVLLEEYHFLNNIIESDKQCHILVPKAVMSELMDYIASTNNIPARRTFYNFLKHIDSGCALIGEEPKQDYGHANSNPAFTTCLEKFDQDYHVILLTSDSKVLSYKKFSKILIFSVDEVKLLINNKKTPISVSHAVPQTDQPSSFENSLKINERKVQAANENIKDKDVTPSKLTADAAIQTETVTVISSHNIGMDEDKSLNNENVACYSNNTGSEKSCNHSITARSNCSVKKREIKLKRCITSQALQPNSVDNNIQKKPCRWRRKRNQNQTDASTNDAHISESKVASVQTNPVTFEFQSQATEGAHHKHGSNDNSNSSEIAQSIKHSDTSMQSTVNFVIEETSTSGIISNTDSNIDFEINNYNFKAKDNEGSLRKDNCEIIMFEIDSENMVESLKTKCEEWVSRFIQIMEEVLAIVLRKEPAFSNIEFPPPWTVHEAAQCIGKYSNDRTIKNIADKLSIVLCMLSDATGNINKKITPSQYMEMYSYGVSLLNAMKAITSCEDIEIAKESLQKLLSDIKNPNYGLNDPEIDQDEDLPSVDVERIAQEHSQLESPKRNNSNDNVTQEVKKEIVFTHGQEKSSFFLNFDLQEVNPNNTLNETNLCNESQEPNNEDIQNENLNEKLNVIDEVNNTPNIRSSLKIVRNFSKCADFEKRLENKQIITDEFDESDEYLEYGSDMSDTFDENTMLSDPNITQITDSTDIEIPINIVTSSPKPVEPRTDNDSNNTFTFMVCILMEEVKTILNEVKVLCHKCYSEIITPQLSKMEKKELKSLVKNVHVHIEGLSTSLKSMLDENLEAPNAPDNSILTAFKKTGVNLSNIDKSLMLQYRNTIANLKEQVDVFLYSIQNIIATFQSQDQE